MGEGGEEEGGRVEVEGGGASRLINGMERQGKLVLWSKGDRRD